MAEYELEKTCRCCGRKFDVLYPQQWAYKKPKAKGGGYDYLCSWKCLREEEQKKNKPKGQDDMPNNKLTAEQKAKAVEIALAGGDFMKYLKECGAKNASAAWDYIKKTLTKENPQKCLELMHKLSERQKEKNRKEAEEAHEKAVKEEREWLESFQKPDKEGTVIARTVEDKTEVFGVPAEEKPEFEFKVTAIRTSLGEFNTDSRNGLIYWTGNSGDKICMSYKSWKELTEQIPRILKVLCGDE